MTLELLDGFSCVNVPYARGHVFRGGNDVDAIGAEGSPLDWAAVPLKRLEGLTCLGIPNASGVVI
jgi:hypothetical protein